MIADLFWMVATSNISLGLLGLVLGAAVVVGFTPLIQYVPVIGSYKPAGQVVSVLAFAALCFLLGVRSADERLTLAELRASLAIKQADLEIASKSLADATQRANKIEADSDEQHKSDADYIATLKLPADCGFEPGPSGVRVAPGTFRRRAPAPAGAR